MHASLCNMDKHLHYTPFDTSVLHKMLDSVASRINVFIVKNEHYILRIDVYVAPWNTVFVKKLIWKCSIMKLQKHL